MNVLEVNDRKMYIQYDDYQDALFITFEKEVGLTYYEELDNGVMIRRDIHDDRVVGYTIRNISIKICQRYLPSLLQKT